MKIRTDFVTNSSSSSFVSYMLEDSAFCRYVYEKMQELGLDYEEYDGTPASYMHFGEHGLKTAICDMDGGLELHAGYEDEEEAGPLFNADGTIMRDEDGTILYADVDDSLLKEDVEKMSDTDMFLSMVGRFLPLEEIAARIPDSSAEMETCFESDKENGKFECDVYTDDID